MKTHWILTATALLGSVAACLPAEAAPAPTGQHISASAQVANMRATAQLMTDLLSVLESVEDKAGADKAAPKAAAIVQVLRQLAEEQKQLAPPSNAEARCMLEMAPAYFNISLRLSVKLELLKPNYMGSEALRSALQSAD